MKYAEWAMVQRLQERPWNSLADKTWYSAAATDYAVFMSMAVVFKIWECRKRLGIQALNP